LVEAILEFDSDDSERVRSNVALGLGGVSYLYKAIKND